MCVFPVVVRSAAWLAGPLRRVGRFVYHYFLKRHESITSMLLSENIFFLTGMCDENVTCSSNVLTLVWPIFIALLLVRLSIVPLLTIRYK